MSDTLIQMVKGHYGQVMWLMRLVLAVLIGLAAAEFFWSAWPGPGFVEPRAASGNTGEAQEAVSVDVSRIASYELFGVKAQDDSADRSVIDAPETRLNLTLTGIVSSDRNGRSRALIRSDRGDQKPYSVGDTIANGVKLHDIYYNRVILDRGGRYETLTLEQEKAEGVERVAASEDVSNEVAESLADVRNELLENPSKMSEYVRFRPHKVGGELKGYRIYPGSNRRLFQQVGLRPGELVTAVNGTPLTETRAAMNVLGNLAEADSLTVTLERGGEQRTVSVSFQ
ncbi:type II secretion system protein GspC [Spectribacter hydrogenoxidans]|uniref:Type II secretion system protein GspC n=1 Tax=Spectribacter hydrogenoxidans TaxID=3075608 RepID=A0ABU3C3U1_9GAMM|nr:type II secretion system protein GspC [Salinisphaera sp. W335]MDT0636207.1 type II secretion system protein GspC [Salinisphaera sp. W335]